MTSRPSVCLVQPRIPQNVGAIGRVCAVTQTGLHIVRPIPFRLNERSLQRSGMDYLDLLDLSIHDGWREFNESLGEKKRLWFLTSKGSRSLYETDFQPTDVLVFGSESAGLPDEVTEEIGDRGIRIPMAEPQARCLNLATSVAVTVYEALRQTSLLGDSFSA